MKNSGMFVKVASYLKNGKVGDYVENEGKVVEIADMVGGRYVCFDKDGFFDRLEDSETAAFAFLMR